MKIKYDLDEDNERFIFLKGNHDEWVRDWLTTGKKNPVWVSNGGQSTMDSYIDSGFLHDKKHIMFYYNMKDYYIDEQNRGFVHGGFYSKLGLGHEIYKSNYYWDRDLWQIALLTHGRLHIDPNQDSYVSQGRRFENHKEIYIGHTPTVNWDCKKSWSEYNDPNQEVKDGPITVPMNRCNVWNLDTGAGWSGKLTIMDIDTKEYWQSDALKKLYNNERGIN